MNNVLFIGGPVDGHRLELRETPQYWYFDSPPDADEMFYRAHSGAHPVTFTKPVRHTYHLEHLYAANGQTFPVYVHSHNTKDTIAMLIEGYRGK